MLGAILDSLSDEQLDGVVDGLRLDEITCLMASVDQPVETNDEPDRVRMKNCGQKRKLGKQHCVSCSGSRITECGHPFPETIEGPKSLTWRLCDGSARSGAQGTALLGIFWKVRRENMQTNLSVQLYSHPSACFSRCGGDQRLLRLLLRHSWCVSLHTHHGVGCTQRYHWNTRSCRKTAVGPRNGRKLCTACERP